MRVEFFAGRGRILGARAGVASCRSALLVADSARGGKVTVFGNAQHSWKKMTTTVLIEALVVQRILVLISWRTGERKEGVDVSATIATSLMVPCDSIPCFERTIFSPPVCKGFGSEGMCALELLPGYRVVYAMWWRMLHGGGDSCCLGHMAAGYVLRKASNTGSIIRERYLR